MRKKLMIVCFTSSLIIFIAHFILYWISSVSSIEIVAGYGIVALIFGVLILFFNKIHYSRSFPWILSIAQLINFVICCDIIYLETELDIDLITL